MSIKTANVVVTFKNKTQKEWEKDLTFIPLKGEIIVYNTDEENYSPKIKIGDGITTINNLPFFQGLLPEIIATDNGKFLQINDGKISTAEANKTSIKVENENIFFEIS